MTVSASSEEAGKVEGTLPVQADNPNRVGLNIKYLLEYLKGKEGMITIGRDRRYRPGGFPPPSITPGAGDAHDGPVVIEREGGRGDPPLLLKER